ncbi:MAG: RNA polymerase II subunit A C-terminal domain phosphatase [Watsoniomyces obsoletus]|nr:MAG: RNA polymerase II subunit A C-terminal domain phosphatase [Watsoniomyces obsoletus]
MDFNSLKDQVSNLSLYDVKAGVRKLQNAVMNFTEMEAKVREATNNEPWGASSTLMQEIANGTFNYGLLNEIMPMIYKRFTEKSAEEWRQIYKALQLLEFLIKNGSERVIDDARSHLSLLKMLRQFHFIDANGKDQGINVRNRAKELADLLSDVDRIRMERKKARATRSKYGGLEGGSTFGSSSNSRYGGFGSEDMSFGGYSGGVYGDGGGFGGNSSGYPGSGGSSGRQDRFEEYDEGDDGAVVAPSSRRTAGSGNSSVRREDASKKKQVEPPKPKEPEVDLLSIDDPPVVMSSNGKGSTAASAADDEFDDFQSAAPLPASSSTTTNHPLAQALPPPTMTSSSTFPAPLAAPKPVSGGQNTGLNNLVAFSSVSPTPSNTSTPPSFTPQQQQQAMQPPIQTGPNYYTSVPVALNNQSSSSNMGMATKTSTAAQPMAAASINSSLNKPTMGSSGPGNTDKSGNDAFGSIWSSVSAGVKKSNSSSQQHQQGPNLASMAKEKASAGIWGTSSVNSNQNTSGAQRSLGHGQGGQSTSKTSGGGGMDDLLS